MNSFSDNMVTESEVKDILSNGISIRYSACLSLLMPLLRMSVTSDAVTQMSVTSDAVTVSSGKLFTVSIHVASALKKPKYGSKQQMITITWK